MAACAHALRIDVTVLTGQPYVTEFQQEPLDLATMRVTARRVLEEFAQALAAAGMDVHASLQEPTTEIQTRRAGLLTGAQQAGAGRPELGLPEFIALLAGTSRAMEQLGADPEPRERIFEVVFDGLRPR